MLFFECALVSSFRDEETDKKMISNALLPEEMEE